MLNALEGKINCEIMFVKGIVELLIRNEKSNEKNGLILYIKSLDAAVKCINEIENYKIKEIIKYANNKSIKYSKVEFF